MPPPPRSTWVIAGDGTLNVVTRSQEEQLRAYYDTLFQAWGYQHWWPADSRFEVIVGAYLTQNTAWTNVERALSSLRVAGALNLDGIRSISLPELEMLIRSSGYFRQKARRLKAFVAFLDQRHAGSLNRMFAQPTAELRDELLTLNGVGPETADSILLYAGQHPVFVVDAYTRRILERHGMVTAKTPYEEIRGLWERALSRKEKHPAVASSIVGSSIVDSSIVAASINVTRLQGAAHAPSRMSRARRTPLAQVYNDLHGLIVEVGKNYCLKSKPKCERCPLQKFLPNRAEGDVNAGPLL